jgi:hypothetical protein
MRIPVIDVPGKPGTKKLQANSGGSSKVMRLCAFDSSSIRRQFYFLLFTSIISNLFGCILAAV